MVTKGLNKITQNETQELQLVDNFCKSWDRICKIKNEILGIQRTKLLGKGFIKQGKTRKLGRNGAGSRA